MFLLFVFRKKDSQAHLSVVTRCRTEKYKKKKKKTLCSCLNVLLVCLTGLWWHTGQGWRFQTPPWCPFPLRVDRPVGRRLRSPACSPGRNAERVEMVSGGNNLRQTTTATKKKQKNILFLQIIRDVTQCELSYLCIIHKVQLSLGVRSVHKEMSHKMQINF